MSAATPATTLGSRARCVGVLAAGVITRIGRDRTALFFVVVLPIVIILVIGATFFSDPGQLTVGITGPETGAGAAVVSTLHASPGFSVERYPSAADLDRAVRRRTVPAGLIFGAHDRGGASSPVRLVADPASPAGQAVRQAVIGMLQREGVVEAAAAAVAGATGVDRDQARTEARASAANLAPVEIRAAVVGSAAPTPGQFTYPAASNLVLFVFLNSLAVSAALIRDRRLGVTRRILAAPISPGLVVVGDGLGRLTFALLQAGLIVVVGAALFGVSWGDPVAAVALIVVFSVTATAAGLLLGVLVGSEDLAGSLAPPAGIALGMLGGTMWPLEIVPPPMQAVGRLTPHAWAMDAWIALIFDHDGIGGVALELAVLGGFAVVFAAVAVPLTRRRLTTTG